jgi:hypothetical protein
MSKEFKQFDGNVRNADGRSKRKKTERVKILCEIKLLISLAVDPHEFLRCENEMI